MSFLSTILLHTLPFAAIATWIGSHIVSLVQSFKKTHQTNAAMAFLASIVESAVGRAEQTVGSAIRNGTMKPEEIKAALAQLGESVLADVVAKCFDQLKAALGLPDEQITKIIKDKVESEVPMAKALVANSLSTQG